MPRTIYTNPTAARGGPVVPGPSGIHQQPQYSAAPLASSTYSAPTIPNLPSIAGYYPDMLPWQAVPSMQMNVMAQSPTTGAEGLGAAGPSGASTDPFAALLQASGMPSQFLQMSMPPPPSAHEFETKHIAVYTAMFYQLLHQFLQVCTLHEVFNGK